MPHTRAAICRLGHVVSRDIELDAPDRRCPKCGVTVFSECVTCSEPIEGPEYEPPTLCRRCKITHPWGRVPRRRAS